jgi:dTDP-4-amino-4,6-dideoxygalactose transaminase
MNIKQIPMFKVAMCDDKKFDEELLKVIHSGWIGEGQLVKNFEDKLSQKFNNKNVATLSAGTHAITLALHMSGIKPGDEVISTPLSCQATSQPILYFGGKIVWADINKNLNISANSIKESITDKTKCILFVNWGGYPADLEEIYNIAKERDIKVIEDAAHCYGSTYKNSIIGDCQYCHFSVISTQAIKALTTIDGGILFTKNKQDYERAKLLRWYGISRENNIKDMRCTLDNPIVEHGYKFHMNNVCAQIGISNMKLAEENVKISIDNANYYNEKLKNIDGIEIVQNASDRQSSYWLYTILVEDRTSFANMMGKHGVSVSRVHERLDKHPVNKDFQKELPGLESIINKYISIPIGWWVSKEDREFIVDCIKKGW